MRSDDGSEIILWYVHGAGSYECRQCVNECLAIIRIQWRMLEIYEELQLDEKNILTLTRAIAHYFMDCNNRKINYFLL